MSIGPIGQNFDRNAISAVLHENFYIEYFEVQDTIGYIFCKRKKNKKTWSKSIRKCPQILMVKNFD